MLWLTSIMKIYRQKYHTTANVALTMNFTPWLNFKTSYAYRGEHQRQTYHTPAYVADPKAKRDYPYHSETTGYWEEHVWENVLSFNKTFGNTTSMQWQVLP